MNNEPLDEMNYDEKKFIWQVEENRGSIKNQNKFYPILADIFNNGTDAMREQLTKDKMIGIMNIQHFTNELNGTEQDELVKRISEINKPNITKIKMIFNDIVINRKV